MWYVKGISTRYSPNLKCLKGLPLAISICVCVEHYTSERDKIQTTELWVKNEC